LKKPLVIDPEVLRRLLELPKEERIECLLALCELADVFGKPHIHTGLSIRKLTKQTFELRGTLDLRLLFHNRSTDLYVSFLGNHDQVRSALKTGRFD
jgi:hypothetical protein